MMCCCSENCPSPLHSSSNSSLRLRATHSVIIRRNRSSERSYVALTWCTSAGILDPCDAVDMGGREEIMVSRLGSNMEPTHRLSRFRFRPVHGSTKARQMNFSYKKKSRYV